MKIIDSCKSAGLPTPALEEDGGGFKVMLFKNRFSEEEIRKSGLHERQIKAVVHVQEKGSITNNKYQKINDISERTASRQARLTYLLGL